jgi:hypothetical protein
MKLKTRLTNPVEWDKESLLTVMKAVSKDMNSIGPSRQDILINRIATKADNPENRIAFVAFFFVKGRPPMTGRKYLKQIRARGLALLSLLNTIAFSLESHGCRKKI